MNIKEIVKMKELTLYKLAKKSKVPYSTVNDLYNNKTSIAKCSAETVFKLSQALNITMEELLAEEIIERCSFDLFKSNVCHDVKRKGDMQFLIDTIEDETIKKYYSYKWYPECFYTLAMVDYLCRINNLPIDDQYDTYRQGYLAERIYPSSIISLSIASNDESIKEKAWNESIPEFKKYNIIERDIRNVA